MATYAGVTFKIDTQNLLARPLFGRNPNIVTTHIPYSNRDDKQNMGMSDFEWSGAVWVSSEADYMALVAAQGLTKRPFTDFFGVNLSDIMLTKAGPGQLAESDWIVVPITLRYEG